MSENILRKRFASYFIFIYKHLIKCWSSTANPVAVTALLLTSFYTAANKECLTKRQINFRYADSAFPQLYCVKFSFISVDISKCYASKLKGLFSSETFYIQGLYSYFTSPRRRRAQSCCCCSWAVDSFALERYNESSSEIASHSNKSRQRPTAGCCHLANSMAWSQSRCPSILSFMTVTVFP